MAKLEDKFIDLDHLIEFLALQLGYGDSPNTAESVMEYCQDLPLDHVKDCRTQLTELLKNRADMELLRERIASFKINIWGGPRHLETWSAELLVELNRATDCDLEISARGAAELERQRRTAEFRGKSKRKR